MNFKKSRIKLRDTKINDLIYIENHAHKDIYKAVYRVDKMVGQMAYLVLSKVIFENKGTTEWSETKSLNVIAYQPYTKYYGSIETHPEMFL